MSAYLGLAKYQNQYLGLDFCSTYRILENSHTEKGKSWRRANNILFYDPGLKILFSS
jgi:hypothetical protein